MIVMFNLTDQELGSTNLFFVCELSF